MSRATVSVFQCMAPVGMVSGQGGAGPSTCLSPSNLGAAEGQGWGIGAAHTHLSLAMPALVPQLYLASCPHPRNMIAFE